MSLSQRYSGKILTPWFDLMEWKATKELIYSESAECKQIAFNRLKIWKLRTPLLASGVEGTIILLEALLETENKLTSFEMVQIYATALLRFLNICASSNDRQGTFYKVAEKNELPYWLITLRHDIAHGHKLPSKEMLESAINVCFKWIKQKYWDVQDSFMHDYVVVHEVNFKELVSNYAHLNLLSFFNENTDNLILNMEKTMCDVVTVDNELTANKLLTLFEEYLLESVKQNKIKDISSLIVSALVDDDVILSISSVTVYGVKRIPSEFIQIWIKIINLLYQTSTIFRLINELVDVTEKYSRDSSAKEIASLWIAEIYQGLLKVKTIQEEYEDVRSKHSDALDPKTAHLILLTVCNSNPAFKDTITFDVLVDLPFQDSKLFQDKILAKPNEYTTNYLESVLRFNGYTKDFIKAQYKIIKNLVQYNPSFYISSDTMHSVSELEELKKTLGKGETTYQSYVERNSEKRKKFRKLTNSEKDHFKGYPLGLCPQWSQV